MKPSTKTTPSGDDIHITLGDGWQRFAFTTRGLAFLGTIRRGMEIGALAWDEAGGYLQINGDIHQVLNKSRVAAHLRKASVRPQPTVVTWQPTETERAAVSVVIKRRRRMLVPQVSKDTAAVAGILEHFGLMTQGLVRWMSTLGTIASLGAGRGLGHPMTRQELPPDVVARIPPAIAACTPAKRARSDSSLRKRSGQRQQQIALVHA